MRTSDFATGVYEHYRGGKYLALMLATDCDTQAPMVVYVSLDGDRKGTVWVRPFREFNGWVSDDAEHRPTPHGVGVERFRLLVRSNG